MRGCLLEHESLLVPNAANECERSAVSRELRSAGTSGERVDEASGRLACEVGVEDRVYARMDV